MSYIYTYMCVKYILTLCMKHLLKQTKKYVKAECESLLFSPCFRIVLIIKIVLSMSSYVNTVKSITIEYQLIN